MTRSNRFPARALIRGAALLALLAAAALASGCGRGGFRAEPAGLRVSVSIPPLKYFVERIAGPRVQVEALVKPGQDPHTYDPTPRQVAALARSRLFFLAGFPFEHALVPRLESTMPDLAIVDTREGIALQEEGDPHIWMSPPLARRQAQTIRDALIRADPAGESVYRAGFDRLAAELDQVHAELTAALAPLRGRELLVYHPAFGYFAAEYGLTQVAVETGGREPTAQRLARLIELARERGIRVVFVQPQFSQAGARAVAEAIGGAVVPLDDLPSDYLANLRDLSRKIQEALNP